MKNIVNSTVKFSYNISKGSIKNRQKLISKYNKQIFSRLEQNLKDNYISVADAQKAIDEVLPEKKVIQIRPISSKNKKEDVGNSDFLYGKNWNIVGQTIGIPIKNNKISIKNLSIFMHELTHVINTLLNPKTTARVNGMYLRRTYTENLSNIIDKKLYNYENIEETIPFISNKRYKKAKKEILQTRENELLKFLKGYSVKDKIDYIQKMRNTLIEERTAYTEEEKYAWILTKKHKIHLPKFNEIGNLKGYFFDEKIKILKKIGFEIIDKERKEHAKKLKTRRKK